MDTSLIYQALEQPSLRKQIPLEELERIQAAYPYFTAAQVLLAKIYQENKDHRYADQLQQAALYAIDRKVLSEYMKESEEEGKRESEKEGLSTGSRTGENEEVGKWGNGETGKRENEEVGKWENGETEKEQNENEKHNENELSGERENVDEGENSGEYVFITDEELSIFEGKAIQDEIEDLFQAQGPGENEEVGLSTGSRTGEMGKWENGETGKRESEEEEKRESEEVGKWENGETEKEQAEVEEKSARVEMSDFDRQLLIEAVHSSIEMEVGEENEEEGLSTGSDTEQKQKQNENELRGESENERTKTEEIERIEAKDPSELTFGELMMLKAARMGTIQNENEKQNENELRGVIEDEEEDEDIRLSTNEERTEERGKNFDYLYKLHNGGLAPIDAPNEKEKQKSIIDRFIKLEPKITPGKVSEYNTASNLAKESLEEDFSFATETMAKLFIAQGKFDKAKKVYRKLMELHPEKNVYFAAQLKNLNQNKKQ